MTALDLLSGDAQTFVEKVWASRVHLHHADPEELVGLLSLRDVDGLLTGTAIRTPAVRVAQDGHVLPASSYTRGASLAGQPLTGLVDGRRLLDLFDAGATVVLQGLQRYWAPLGELVAGLELELGHPCQANAYLTPPSAQGFAVHRDSHDVFVFQTHGSKQWEVHPRAEDHGSEEPRSVLLEPGACLYLPTGTPHAARAQESVSLHVTVGINQLTWRTLLDRALAAPLADLGTGHLPAGYLDDPRLLAAGLRERLDSLVGSLGRVDAHEVASEQAERFWTGRTSTLRGGLLDRAGLAVLGDDTELRRRPGRPCVLRPAEDRLRLLLGDRELSVPAWLTPALSDLSGWPIARSFTPRDLGDHLDPRSRVVLCRRLVREGLLEIVS